MERDNNGEDIDDVFDRFPEPTQKSNSNETSCKCQLAIKLLKYVSCVACFACLLVGSLVSKACVLILGNSAKPSALETSKNETKCVNRDVVRIWSYFAILLMLLVPEVLTIGHSLIRIIMKNEVPLKMSTFIQGGAFEIVGALGEGIIFFKVLPYLDATYFCLVLPLTGFIPICIEFFNKCKAVCGIGVATENGGRPNRKTILPKFLANLLALILQISGFVLCVVEFRFFRLKTSIDKHTLIWLCAGLPLASCRYWENFLEKIDSVQNLQEKLDESRFKSSLWFSIIRCVVFGGFAFLVLVVLESGTYSSKYVTAVEGHERYGRILHLFRQSGMTLAGNCSNGTFDWVEPQVKYVMQCLWYVLITQSCCAIGVFIFGRMACHILIQRQSYALPITLVTPVMCALTAAVAHYKSRYSATGLLQFVGLAQHHSQLYDCIDWNNQVMPPFTVPFLVVGLILGWFGTTIVTRFIWFPTQVALERTEVLFVKPIYGGPLIDQVLMLNRRQHNRKRGLDNSVESGQTGSNDNNCQPKLFLCATMWHETEKEMTQMLTSIMRMDKETHGHNRDRIEFECHIMFDDAMSHVSGQVKTNEYVKQLFDSIPIAAKNIDANDYNQYGHQPELFATPYGGRMVFKLPYGNVMTVHLKDKTKIRQRKRWSQCMYMYYILGYLQTNNEPSDLNNVFILALDGDVDFQPKSIQLLMDRMKRNPDVGAACGRIHPIGSGPMVWFQKFEYAVGHWFQKATEHVLGCVLCSPGCFSLFRGSALFQAVKTYTSETKEAANFVQWDQGEDRWLCTLLLKLGWRIEYCAASDSYTFAPEEFKEFYNQRRRWVTSTMANLFDIFSNAGEIVKRNKYISWGYIIYQVGLMVSSILGPATVILTVQGSFQYVLMWDAPLALVTALVPVLIFVVICYTTKPDKQILVAGILTMFYAVVMMAVAVGVIASVIREGVLHPGSIFFITLVSLYIFAALIHPQEMLCMLHGLLYYICVPSAFILLVVYSLTNMNQTSWGTRDKKQQQKSDKGQCKELLTPVNGNDATFVNSNNGSESFLCNVCNLFSCSIGSARATGYRTGEYFPLSQNDPADTAKYFRRRTTRKKSKETVSPALTPRQIRVFELPVRGSITTASVRRKSRKQFICPNISENSMDCHPSKGCEQPGSSHREVHTSEEELDSERQEEEENEDLAWVTDFDEGVFNYHFPRKERDFWIRLIDDYLRIDSKVDVNKMQVDLNDLRNKMSGAFLFANLLWLALNFAIQLSFKDVKVEYPLYGKNVQISPLAFAFLIFFLVILLVQFVCMLLHRLSTLLHLLASTPLKFSNVGCCCSSKDHSAESSVYTSEHVNAGFQAEETNGELANGIVLDEITLRDDMLP